MSSLVFGGSELSTPPSSPFRGTGGRDDIDAPGSSPLTLKYGRKRRAPEESPSGATSGLWCRGQLQEDDEEDCLPGGMLPPMEFTPGGYLASGELERLHKRQMPVKLSGPELENIENVPLFQVTKSHTSLYEDTDSPKAACWIKTMAQTLQFMGFLAEKGSAGPLKAIGNHVTVDRLAQEASQRLSELRGSAFCLGARPDPSSGIRRALELLSELHASLGELRAHAASSDPRAPESRLRHLVLDALFTLRSCVTMMERVPAQSQDLSNLFHSLPPFALPGVSEAELHGLRGLRTRVTAQLLNHLIQIAFKRFQEFHLHHSGLLGGASSSSKSSRSFFLRDSFGCSCIRELWFMLLKDLEWEEGRREGHEEAHLAFWRMFSRVCDKEQEKAGPFFKLWLLHNLAPLCALDARTGTDRSEEENPEEVSSSSKRVKVSKTMSNQERQFYNSLFDHQAKTCLSNPDTTEQGLRVLVSVLERSSRIFGPSLPALNLLWEYFHKRLGSKFVLGSGSCLSLGSVAVLPKTPGSWLKMLEVGTSAAPDLNSYQRYLRLLQVQLSSQGQSGRSPKQQEDLKKLDAKLIGRVLARISPRKLRELNELGWFQLLSLYLSLVSASADGDGGVKTSTKLLGTLSHIKSAGDIGPVAIYLKGLGALSLLLQCRNKPQDNVLKEMVKILDMHIEQRFKVQNQPALASLCQMVVAGYADFLTDSLSSENSGALLGQPCLISSQLGRYLRLCHVSEIRKLLSSTVTLVTKLRRYFKSIEARDRLSLTAEEQAFEIKVGATHEALWTSLFPAVERHLASSLTAAAVPEVAEFVTGMVRLSMDRPRPESDFEKLFLFFSQSPSVRPTLSCNFLQYFLQSGPESARRLYLSQGSNAAVIKGWLRCAVLLSRKEDLECLNQVSREVLQLPEFCELITHIPHSLEEDQSEEQGVNLFRAFLEAIQHMLNSRSVDDPVSLRKSFQMDYVVEVLRGVKRAELDRTGLLHLYRTAGLLVQHCAPLLHQKGNGRNLLSEILTDLVASNVMQSDTFVLSQDLRVAVEASLPSFVRGLVSIPDFRRDQFVMRMLKTLFVVYVPRFPADDRHPLLVVFDRDGSAHVASEMAKTRQKEEELQAHFLLVLKSQVLPKRPHLRGALQLLLLALQRTQDRSGLSRLVSKWLTNALLHYRFFGESELDSGVKTSTTQLLQCVADSCKTNPTSLKAVQEAMKSLISAQMSFNSPKLFSMLSNMGVLLPEAVRALMPLVSDQVMVVEGKRGFGHDARLGKLWTEFKRHMDRV